jgi:NADH-quinone oxidoreductase subunit L
VPLHHGEHHHPPVWVVWAPLGVTITGFLIAVLVYLVNNWGKLFAKGPLHAFLYNKWYFDELYDFVFVKGARALGDFFWKAGDQKVIDGLGPNGFAAASNFVSRQMRRVQSGYVYHYSFLMLVAAVAFGAYAIWSGTGAGAAP